MIDMNIKIIVFVASIFLTACQKMYFMKKEVLDGYIMCRLDRNVKGYKVTNRTETCDQYVTAYSNGEYDIHNEVFFITRKNLEEGFELDDTMRFYVLKKGYKLKKIGDYELQGTKEKEVIDGYRFVEVDGAGEE